MTHARQYRFLSKISCGVHDDRKGAYRRCFTPEDPRPWGDGNQPRFGCQLHLLGIKGPFAAHKEGKRLHLGEQAAGEGGGRLPHRKEGKGIQGRHLDRAVKVQKFPTWGIRPQPDCLAASRAIVGAKTSQLPCHSFGIGSGHTAPGQHRNYPGKPLAPPPFG